MNLRHCLSTAAFFAASVPAFAAQFPSDIQQANILHCFDWKFTDIQAELPRIAAAGFGAVQVSPVQGNCGDGAEWFYAYLPYDFKMRDDKANGNGTRAQLSALCAEADKYGIKIIVDVVSNHVNPSTLYRDAWWGQGGRERNEGAVNYNSRYSITHGNLGQYKDVNSELPEVQQRIKDFLIDLRSLGVKGIRWDAAKHIGLPSEGCDFWKAVKEVDGLWHYGEILDNPGTSADTEWKVMREYTQYMSVTDVGFGSTALNMLKQGKMPVYHANLALTKAEYGQDFPGQYLVYWGESHDTYANDGGNTKNVDQKYIDRAYMLGACRLKETAVYFSRPSEKVNNRIRMGRKGSTEALESKAIGAVNIFRVNMAGIDEKTVHKYGATGYFVNARLDAGVLILLPTAGERDIEVQNPGCYAPQGTFTDAVGGSTFTVTADIIKGHVGPEGVAVLYKDGFQGVDEIAIPDESKAPVFYDLAGRRVANPERGLYIKVHHGRSTKVVL